MFLAKQNPSLLLESVFIWVASAKDERRDRHERIIVVEKNCLRNILTYFQNVEIDQIYSFSRGNYID
jgi:hypothetical protein